MTTQTPIAIFPGVYHAVHVGMWLEPTGEPVWAVDIDVKIDGGPDAVVGNGPTLQAALDAAVANFRAYVEEAA